METMKINSVKIGEFIKRKADSNKVYKRGEYDRSTKSFELIDTDDINRSIYIKSGAMVFVGFTY
jgi:hypothetical protein